MELSPRFDDALQFASVRHRSQMRKGTAIPYISHVLMVAAIALEHEATEDEAIAALLHDVLEDTDTTASEIEEKFGSAVCAIVQACSDTTETPKPPWKDRKEAYLAHLRTASASDLLVSASDKLANARSLVKDGRALGNQLWSRFNASREQSLWYYGSLVDIFEERARTAGRDPLVAMAAELKRVVNELKSY